MRNVLPIPDHLPERKRIPTDPFIADIDHDFQVSLGFSDRLLATLQVLLASPTIVFLLLGTQSKITYPHLEWSFWAAVLIWCVALFLTLLSIVVVLLQFPVVQERSVKVRCLACLIGAGVVVAGAYWLANRLSNADAGMVTDAAIFVERVGTWQSGVTPLLPLSALLAAVCLWAVYQLLRLQSLHIYPLANPFTNDAASPNPHLAGVYERFKVLNDLLSRCRVSPMNPTGCLFAVGMLVIVYHLFVVRWVQTAEPVIFDQCYRWWVVVVLVCFGHLIIRLETVCALFLQLLKRLGQHAMVEACDRVPEQLRATVAGQIFSVGPDRVDLEAYSRCLSQLATAEVRSSHEEVRVAGLPGGDVLVDEEIVTDSRPVWEAGSTTVAEIHKRLSETLTQVRDPQQANIEAGRINCRLAEIARDELVPKLLDYWDTIPLKTNKDSIARSGKQSDGREAGHSDIKTEWQKLAETFVAMLVVTLIRQMFVHIRSMMTCAVLMLFCLLVAFQGYPFQPSDLMLSLWIGLLAWTLLVVIVAMVRFNKNEFLSRLSRTTPHRFNFDPSFLIPFVFFVVTPIVGLLSLCFPSLGRLLFGWLGTLGRLLGT